MRSFVGIVFARFPALEQRVSLLECTDALAAVTKLRTEAQCAALEGLKVNGCFTQCVDLRIDLSAGNGMFDRVGSSAELIDRYGKDLAGLPLLVVTWSVSSFLTHPDGI